MQITYIANTGFLISTASKKILIDALFGEFDADWCAVPSREIIEKMETGKEPFDQIDLILITHAHMDHFNPQIVLKHLASNTTGVLICSQQVRQELEKHQGYEKHKAQIKEITPDFKTKSDSISVNGMDIKVWRLKHSSYYLVDEETGRKYNRHKNVQNLGFMINIENKKIFHGGDWISDDSRRKTNPLQEEKMDIAFLDIGAFLRLFAPNLRTVDQTTRPGDVFLMHIPPSFSSEELTIEEKELISTAAIFDFPMEIKYR